ncbi:hypothetical protein EVAR_59451_1 [Eumeta japonica]|uniref:Uncharacterized protein n=1 Tax=Eumeta variegata TaxID=151549 RepID=A0A4C1YZG3_EUMVA|nr:hypothetical protein EVAR_59451_1 [Eumeta japonica]
MRDVLPVKITCSKQIDEQSESDSKLASIVLSSNAEPSLARALSERSHQAQAASAGIYAAQVLNITRARNWTEYVRPMIKNTLARPRSPPFLIRVIPAGEETLRFERNLK